MSTASRRGSVGCIRIPRRPVVREVVGILYPSHPVLPGDVAAVDEDGLVVAVIAYVLEEDAASKQRDLEGLYIDVGMVRAPSVGPDAVGDQRREEAVEVEEEEDGPALVSERVHGGSVAMYKVPEISNSTRKTQLKPERGFSGSETGPEPAIVQSWRGCAGVVHRDAGPAWKARILPFSYHCIESWAMRGGATWTMGDAMAVFIP
jgi:hypothetical protein